MASIKKYLDAIKAAVYGEEVRGSIHDAIKAIYDIATGAQGSATASANTAIAKASEAVAAAKEVTAKAEEAIEAAEQAQISAENAEAVTGVGIASQKKAGLVKGGENYIDESGELQLTKRTDFPTLYNSYAGGIKLNELGGVSEQDSTTGAQLFDASNNYVGGNGTTVSLSQDGKEITISGIASYAKGTFTVKSAILDKIKGTTVTLSGIIKSKTVSTTVVAIQLVVTNADDTKTYNGVLSGSATPVAIPEDAKNVVVDLLVNNTSTALSTTNTVVFEDIMLNAGSTALPWEPFTGNAPSPSPEYKQTIKPVEGKNLLDCRGLVEQTVNGGKFTPVYDDNGNLLYIEVDGTFTARSAYLLNRIATSEECIVSGAPTNGRIQVTSADTQYNDYGSGTTIPSGFEGSVYIIVDANTTLTNLKFYPMIRPASIADDTYVPYGLLRFWGHNKNWLQRTFTGTSTVGGLTYTLQNDSGIKVVGTPSSGDTVMLGKVSGITGTVKFSLGKNASNVIFWVRGVGDVKNNQEITLDGGKYEVHLKRNNNVVTNEVVYPMVCATAITDDTYAPRTTQSITLSSPIKLNGVGTAQDKIVRKDGVWKIERNIIKLIPLSLTHVKELTNTKVYQAAFAEEPLLLGGATPAYCNRLRYKYSQSDEEHFYITNNNGAYLYVPIDYTPVASDFEFECVLATPTYEDLPTADQIALNSLVSYDGITYLYCDSEVQPTWDLEYGTSRVGGYVLETWNKEENNAINNELLKNAILSLGGNV